MRNYCVCIKGKKFLGRISPVKKGDKFWYENDEFIRSEEKERKGYY
jgi:hypothetical protein